MIRAESHLATTRVRLLILELYTQTKRMPVPGFPWGTHSHKTIPLAQQFSKCSLLEGGKVPETPLGDYKGKTVFIIIVRCICLFCFVDIATKDTKAMVVGKSVSALA